MINKYKDGNGTISSIDLGIINRAFGGHTSSDELQEWVKEGDADGDNQITFNEFLKLKLKENEESKANNDEMQAEM